MDLCYVLEHLGMGNKIFKNAITDLHRNVTLSGSAPTVSRGQAGLQWDQPRGLPRNIPRFSPISVVRGSHVETIPIFLICNKGIITLIFVTIASIAERAF